MFTNNMGSRNPDLKSYSLKIAAILVIAAIVYLVEHRFMGSRQGLIMGACEVALEFFCAFVVFKASMGGPSRFAPRTLLAFFLFLGIGDFFYVLIYYGLSWSSRTPLSVSLTTLMYVFAYFSGAVSIVLGASHPRTWMRQASNYFVYLLCIPLALRLLLVPFLRISSGEMNLYVVLMEITGVVGSLLLLAHGLIALIASRTIFWSNFGIGIVTLVISDWALRVEKLVDDAPVFGFYEVLYFIGVGVIAISFTSNKRIPELEILDYRSMTSKTKGAVLIALFLVVLFLSLSNYGTRDAIRIAGVGCILGSVLANFISFFLLREFSTATDLARRITTDAFGPHMTENQNVTVGVPVELRDIVDEAFMVKVSASRDLARYEQNLSIQRKLLDFSEQVSHDIRSPLSALEMISAAKFPPTGST